MSSSNVTARVLKLEDAGAMQGYTVVIDPRAFNLGTAAYVRMNAMPGEAIRLARMLDDTPEVVEADRVTGGDCFLAQLVVSDARELQAAVDRFQPYASADTAIIRSSVVARRLPKLSAARRSAAANSNVRRQRNLPPNISFDLYFLVDLQAGRCDRRDMTLTTDWTRPGSFSAGRDPLGFQAASVRLYTSLVPGLTNVTNRLRYYSFYCWVVWQFEKIHHTTKEDKWIEFIRRCEAAIALACQIGDAANALGMAGSEWWRYVAADTSAKTFDLIIPTNRPGEDGQYLKAKYGNFGQFYTASMLEMGLIESASARVYAVSSTAGKALAVAVQEEHPDACALLLKAVTAGRISRSDCETISEAFHPAYLDSSSQEARLLNQFLQGSRADDPTATARRISLRNVLAVVSDSKGEFDLRRELYVQSGSLGGLSHGVENLTRWRAYFLNEFCHIALEVWLNAIVGLSNQVAEPTLVEALAASLASLAVSDENASTENLAASLALETLGEEHALGAELLAAASVKKMPETSAVTGSTKLILSLWLRWREAAQVRDELLHETVEGRSVEGVFRFLDLNSAANARITIAKLIKKFVVSNHLTIAGQKLATGGRFTYRFTLDDGCLVDGEFGEYTYTQPRIANLLTFANDAHLVDKESGIITAAGAEFLNAA